MIAAALFQNVRRALCVGAHPDDIEIGCGGAIASMTSRYPETEVRWLVLTATAERAAEARVSCDRMLGDAAAVTVHDFRDGFLPYDDPVAVKEALIAHRAGFDPDLVFAPRPGDAHQDHRFLGELVWQVYRGQPILHYEIPKYEGDLGGANVYVALSAAEAESKIEHLHAAFPSQLEKPWFDPVLFRGVMRLRGIECTAPSGYAEAFEAPKLLVT